MWNLAQSMTANLFCDSPNCGLQAAAFSLSQNLVKVLACDKHLPGIATKKQPIFDVAAYSFIGSPEDVALYEQQKQLMQKGLNSLAAIEARLTRNLEDYERELRESVERVRAIVERSYLEAQQTAQEHCNRIKRKLTQTRSNLCRLIVDKGFVLSQEDRTLSEEAQPEFRMALEDCRVGVAEILLKSWQLQVELPDFIEPGSAEKRLLQLFPLTATEEEVMNTTNVSLRKAEQARESGNYEKALQKLRRVEALLKRKGLESPELCLQLGTVLAHFGLHIKAAKKLQQGLEVQRSRNPDSLIAVRLGNCLVELYVQAGQFKEAAAGCQWVLETWCSGYYQVELLRTLYFFTSLDAHAERELVDKGGDLSASTLLLLIRAEQQRHHSLESAAQLYEAALEARQWESSYITACSRHALGHIYQQLRKYVPAEEQLLEARHIFTTHYPHSYGHARCLASVGELYVSTKQQSQAEPLLAAALKVLAEDFCSTEGFGECLWSVGLLHYSQQRLVEAESDWLQACAFFSTHFPQSLCHARCVDSLAHLYFNTEQLESAEQCYTQASQLYSASFPHSLSFASCLLSLGSLYFDTQRSGLAEKVWLQAHSLLESFPQTMETAQCCYNLGVLYHASRRLDLAEQLWDLASAVLTANFPQSLLRANCLNSLGVLYKSMERWEQAESVYLQAYQVLSVSFPETRDYAQCQFNLGVLYASKGRERGKSLLEAGRALFQHTGDKEGVMHCERALKNFQVTSFLCAGRMSC